MTGPAAIKVEGYPLVDPVALAFENLGEALRLLNVVIDSIPDKQSDRYLTIHGLICSVLDQLIGWDCCSEQRLIAPSPGQEVPYRDDLNK